MKFFELQAAEKPVNHMNKKYHQPVMHPLKFRSGKHERGNMLDDFPVGTEGRAQVSLLYLKPSAKSLYQFLVFLQVQILFVYKMTKKKKSHLLPLENYGLHVEEFSFLLLKVNIYFIFSHFKNLIMLMRQKNIYYVLVLQWHLPYFAAKPTLISFG